MKKQKLKLNDLTVKSFTTTLEAKTSQTINGGSDVYDPGQLQEGSLACVSGATYGAVGCMQQSGKCMILARYW